MEETGKITVFYDGACGLCSREINHYRKIADKERFNWVDITQNPEPFTRQGYEVQEGLKALHVQDASGQMHIGVPGFVVIWEHLPGAWPWLGKLAGLPVLKRILQWAYKKFANWRFRRLGYDTSCRLN